MSSLRRIEEGKIQHSQLEGKVVNDIENLIKNLIDIVLFEKKEDVDLDFFDIKGTVLLYGKPGIGKTSIMKNCMEYALAKGVDCYELLIPEIIESHLGQSTKNLVDSLCEFESKAQGILFIDELDRLCINRKSDEVSELKRMLIETMSFFDRMRSTDNKCILCCTNAIEQIDNALIRRFTVCEEISLPPKNELVKYANRCLGLSPFKEKGIITEILEDSMDNTFDSVKSKFRKAILCKNDENVLESFFKFTEK